MLPAAGTWGQLHRGQPLAGGRPQVSARCTGTTSLGRVPRWVPPSQTLEEPTHPGEVPLLWRWHPRGPAATQR